MAEIVWTVIAASAPTIKQKPKRVPRIKTVNINIDSTSLHTFSFTLYQKGVKKCAGTENFCNIVCDECHDGKKLWRCCDLSHKVEHMSNNIYKAIFMDGVFKYVHWLAS